MSRDNIAGLDAIREQPRGGGAGAPPAPDERPVVRLVPGEEARAVKEIDEALLTCETRLYTRGGRVVKIAPERIKCAKGETGTVLHVVDVTVPYLRLCLSRAAHFERWDVRAEAWGRRACPKDLAEQYLSATGEWKLPALVGVVTAPILRPDGTVLDRPGYDEATGLVFDAQGVEFPKIPDHPTKEEALEALAVLEAPIERFPFDTKEDRAAALSLLLTAVARRALPAAPGHAVSAPKPGSGKTKLVNVAAVIATGEKAAATTPGANEEEIEKRIAASMLVGDPIILINNVEHPLGGGFLNDCITETRINIRVLGKSRNVVVENTALIAATGNNLRVRADATRRWLLCYLDARAENPETLAFAFDPVELARERRPELVAAALTILRAYVVAEDVERPTPLGGFEAWSRVVRDALIWLGAGDPCATMERVRAEDPKRGKLKAMMRGWLAAGIGDEALLVRDVIERAQKMHEEGEQQGQLLRPDLREAVAAVATGKDGKLSSDKLSAWLRDNARSDAAVEPGGPTRRFVKHEVENNTGKWKLEETTKKGTWGHTGGGL
jgi:putative DNA primase/helicase